MLDTWMRSKQTDAGIPLTEKIPSLMPRESTRASKLVIWNEILHPRRRLVNLRSWSEGKSKGSHIHLQVEHHMIFRFRTLCRCYWTFVNIFGKGKSYIRSLPTCQRISVVGLYHLPVGEKKERLGQLKLAFNAPKGRTMPNRRCSWNATRWEGFRPAYIRSRYSRRDGALLTVSYPYWASPIDNVGDTRWPKTSMALGVKMHDKVEDKPIRDRKITF